MIQAVPSSSLSVASAQTTAEQKKLKSAAQAFEAVFLRQMISSMRQASLGDGMFDNEGTEQFQSMADAKTADAMAGRGVLGIADMLMKQLGPVAAKGTSGLKMGTASALSGAATSTATDSDADNAAALAGSTGQGDGA